MLRGIFSFSSHLIFILALFDSFETVLGDTNITVDDNDASIQYSDGWSVSSGYNALDYGGFHHLSNLNTSTASFSFIGTAVYIMAPLWPYAVGASAGVDGAPPVSISMQDTTHTTDGGPEDVQSTVLWGVTGLSNSSHTLQISFWDIEEYMALDAIVYTVPGPTSSTSLSTATSASSSSPSTAPPNSTSESSPKSRVAIIAGAAAGIAVLVVVAMALCICITRRRRNSQNHRNRTISEASAFTGAEGKATSAELLSTPLSASLNSPASFGNSLNQRPSTYFSEANSFSTAGAAGVGAGYDAAHQYANAAPRANTMSSFSVYSQPPVSQYGPDQNYTSYNPWDPPAITSATAASAYSGANSAGGKRDSSDYQISRAPGSIPPVRVNPYLAPGQVVLSYGGSVAASETAGSSSSRSDVYTTKPTNASEEKRRLALASRAEEEPEEAPPTYST